MPRLHAGRSAGRAGGRRHRACGADGRRVQGAARTSGYLRDKTLAQWIALNRLAEVRLTVNKLAQSATTTIGSTTGNTTSSTTSADARELEFAGRTWHYDTRYYDTTFPSMKRIVVRVWAGDAKTKGNPLAETTGFFGASLGQPGNSNTDWTGTIGNTACGRRTASGAGASSSPIGGVIGAGSTSQATGDQLHAGRRCSRRLAPPRCPRR